MSPASTTRDTQTGGEHSARARAIAVASAAAPPRRTPFLSVQGSRYPCKSFVEMMRRQGRPDDAQLAAEDDAAADAGAGVRAGWSYGPRRMARYTGPTTLSGSRRQLCVK